MGAATGSCPTLHASCCAAVRGVVQVMRDLRGPHDGDEGRPDVGQPASGSNPADAQGPGFALTDDHQRPPFVFIFENEAQRDSARSDLARSLRPRFGQGPREYDAEVHVPARRSKEHARGQSLHAGGSTRGCQDIAWVALQGIAIPLV
jgi:hypothetical protein